MEVIQGTALSNLCDYSFGDHLGGIDQENLVGGFMKPAHPANAEFLIKAKQFEGRVMTLFIDNIRLYNRPIEVKPEDAPWVTYLLSHNDLLQLVGQMKDNKFIIFTSHEDTPIDEHIKDRIPSNVLAIYATNAIYNNDKVIPFPYGLQRPMKGERRIEIMKERIAQGTNPTPNKLLYINCGLGSERNAKERAYLPNFNGLEWTTCRFDKDSKFFGYDRYNEFLDEMQNHKFMICPQGHGIDCHRNWELLYMRRVPVMKDHPYFRRLMAGWPVLFVNDWPEVTKELLEANDYLYQEAQTMDLSRLDLKAVYNSIVSTYSVL